MAVLFPPPPSSTNGTLSGPSVPSAVDPLGATTSAAGSTLPPTADLPVKRRSSSTPAPQWSRRATGGAADFSLRKFVQLATTLPAVLQGLTPPMAGPQFGGGDRPGKAVTAHLTPAGAPSTPAPSVRVHAVATPEVPAPVAAASGAPARGADADVDFSELARVGLQSSPEARRIWMLPSTDQIHAEMEGNWGDQNNGIDAIHARIFRADGALDLEAFHREMKVSSPEALMRALHAASWCEGLGRKAMESMSDCLKLAKLARASTPPGKGGRTPSGEDAKDLLVVFLASGRAYLPYLENKAGTSLARGRFPAVRSATRLPYGMAAATNLESRRVVVYDRKQLSSARLRYAFSHELFHAMDELGVDRFVDQLQQYHNLLRDKRTSPELREVLKSALSEMNLIPVNINAARREISADLMAALITKKFSMSDYQIDEKFGINEMAKEFLGNLKVIHAEKENELHGEARASLEAYPSCAGVDPLPVLIRAHLSSDAVAIGSVMGAMDRLAHHPEYKDKFKQQAFR